jgi:indole-3-glycerol phosphate synthase/phosphoribosylanthranilate isomerase
MREANLDAAVRALVYGRTKVCGLTRSEDASAAWRAGATHGGLIFAESSPRRVSPEAALTVRRDTPLSWVGVFADQPAEQIVALARDLELNAVQLHGAESPGTAAELRARLPKGCEVWKAVRVDALVPRRSETGADRVMLDGPASSRCFDWSLLADDPERSAAVLAGGLRPENVTEAAALGTFAVDVSSGVEAAPGKKDPERIAAFLRARRRLPGRGAVAP